MRTVNIHEAKTNLSRLIEGATQGDAFVIAKAGKPQVVVTAVTAASGSRRLGFMIGQGVVPDDFDRLGEGEMDAMFNGQTD